MKYLAIILFFSSSSAATECTLNYLLKGYSPEGVVRSQALVPYPQLFNDASDPLLIPIARNLPQQCLQNECHLQVKLRQKIIFSSKYFYKQENNYWVADRMLSQEFDFDGYNINHQNLIFLVKYKKNELCRYVVDIELRD